MLFLHPVARELIVAHALGGFPDEACGFLVGSAGEGSDEHGLPIATVRAFVPARNLRESSRTYEIGIDGWNAADAMNEENGWQTVGVAHSHTHSEAWPSPTDVDDADNPMLDPAWHYLIVSLRDATPVVRSFLLADRTIREEQVVLSG
jgi:proteasome lid subunit RPN8/RPN11